MAKFIGIAKTQTLGEIMNSFPEVAPVLTQSGLHCVGCHVSPYETLEQGCLGHGMSESDIDEIVRLANDRIKMQDLMPPMDFDESAVSELKKRLGKKKFIKIVPVFGGQFDFDAVDNKEADDVEISAKHKKISIPVLVESKIERMLRGVKIKYDSKKKDFDAEQVSQA